MEEKHSRSSYDDYLTVSRPHLERAIKRPGEFKYTMSVVLAGMWCAIFGIYTVELTFIGYNILGHIAVITGVFVTHRVFQTAREYSPNQN